MRTRRISSNEELHDSFLDNQFLGNGTEMEEHFQLKNFAYTFIYKNIYNMRNAVGNEECRICLEKIQKFQLFWHTLSLHATQLDAVPSIGAKILAF